VPHKKKRHARVKSAEGIAPPALTARTLWPWLLGTSLALVALVALDQFVLHPGVLQTFQELKPLSPLYAFWMPELRGTAVLFVLLAFSCAFLVPRLISPRMSAKWFAASLLVLSLALPAALFLVREDFLQIGSQFVSYYPGDEFLNDARRTVNLGRFIRHYTQLVPQLSLHGRVHPPGLTAFLFLVGHAVSPSPVAAGVAVLLVFATGVMFAWRAFAAILDQRAARIAALTLLAAPSLLDFACTSMDAVFFGASCLVLFTSFLSLSDRGRWFHAVSTGVALYLAMFCSFSAVPLGLFIALFGVLIWWGRRTWRVPLQLSIAFVSFLIAHVGVRIGLGFDLWEGFRVARQQHYQIMEHVIGRSVASTYLPITVGNIAAFLIGTGLAIVPWFVRAGTSVLKGTAPRALFLATGVTLAVICAGGLYTMETERILMFAMPWLAVSAAAVARPADSAVVLMIGAGWIQTLAMEVFLFTLW
jgi:hypothetical protein